MIRFSVRQALYPFPDDWPVFLPRTKIGGLGWKCTSGKLMELNYGVPGLPRGAPMTAAKAGMGGGVEG